MQCDLSIKERKELTYADIVSWPLRGDGDEYTLLSWEGVKTNNRQNTTLLLLVKTFIAD